MTDTDPKPTAPAVPPEQAAPPPSPEPQQPPPPEQSSKPEQPPPPSPEPQQPLPPGQAAQPAVAAPAPAGAPLSAPSTLEQLAQWQFADLNPIERLLLQKASSGDIAMPAGTHYDSVLPYNDPANASQWPAESEVRAALLRWMCTDQKALGRVDPKGVLLFAARITGDIDFIHVTVPFPIRLWHCLIAGEIRAWDASLETLDFRGSILKSGMSANGMNIKHDLNLSRLAAPQPAANEQPQIAPPCRSEKGLLMENCTIGGNLVAIGASITGGVSTAIDMDRANVAGGVYFREGFRAQGQVRLLDAAIGSTLDCSGGTFFNPDGRALNADGASVSGSIFLNDGFHAEGEVNLVGASIGGTLDCSASAFHNPPGPGNPAAFAISADRASIKGGVFFNQNFQASGAVRLPGAGVGVDIVCRDGNFINPNGLGLMLEGAHVEGNIDLRGMRIEKDTALNLLDASAGHLLDDPKDWPLASKLQLIGFEYKSISGSVLDAEMRLRWLRLQYPLPQYLKFSLQPYRQLSRVLHDHGLDSDARKVLIEMENDRRRYAVKSSFAKLWSQILRVTIGYGHRPARALWWLLAFCIIGWLAFGSLYQAGRLVPTEKEAFAGFQAAQRPPAYYRPFCAAVYSADVMLPLVSLGQRDAWRPRSPEETVTDKDRPLPEAYPVLCGGRFPAWVERPLGTTHLTSFPRVLHWILILVGWFFATMFALGVTGLVRRE